MTYKNILRKIKSVNNTRKITKAMQMVATSKMHKTQGIMLAARPYATIARSIMAHLAQVNPSARNIAPFLRHELPVSAGRVGIIVITADKGLCGGLNANIIKMFYDKVRACKLDAIDIDVCAIGHKGLIAANKLEVDIISAVSHLGDKPRIAKIIGPVSGMLRRFNDGKIDALHVIYTKFINTMKQQTICEQLLPLTQRDLVVDTKMPWDYAYEPDDVTVLNELSQRYIESVIFQCWAENMASEMAARMIAMRAATDNAIELMESLGLIYNKSRQAAITNEIAEIVAGCM